MRVLCACEESQRVCMEFRALGHDAYSCDIISCSGGHPELHILGDVKDVLNGGFGILETGEQKHFEPWDLIIGFPPCTYLSVVANRYYSLAHNDPEKVLQRMKNREKAALFFKTIYYARCDHVAVENPVGYMNTHFKKPTQIIHPYYFGEPVQKKHACGCVVCRHWNPRTCWKNRNPFTSVKAKNRKARQ